MPNPFFLSFISAIILIVYSLLFFYGVNYGTAGLGGALVTTLIPINTFVLIAFMTKKIITLRHSFALVLGGFGVLTMLDIYSFNITQIFAQHNLFFLAASVCWPLLTLLSAKMTRIHPLVSTFYIYILSTVALYIFFIEDRLLYEMWQWDAVFWINIFVISVLSTTFATSVYFVGVEKLGAKEVSSFIFLVPTSALFFSYIFLDEHISFNIIIGTLCTLIAIYILNDLKFKKRF
jgi:drug/metabolite transporter (DMT)-like permease